jgi:hypothetical protein
MTTTCRIDMLPARQGDCLWIEYGDPQQPHRLLIDGGTTGTYEELRRRLLALPADQRSFELLIVTHVDSDHIGGVLELLSQTDSPVSFGDIWFNGWRHLPGSGFEEFGPVQGEKLTRRLERPDLPWNERFEAHPVVILDADPLPTRVLPGGMELTLLSPETEQLVALRPVWEEACKEAGLDPSHTPAPPEEVPAGFEVFGPPDVETLASAPFDGDDSEANGSSIAILAEFDGKRMLLAGDAYADVLLESIQRLVGPGEDDRLELDAFKLPHHGSKANVNRTILDRIKCARYLFSTNGAYHRHPDREAVARVIKFGGPDPELVFNYRTEFNRIWDSTLLMEQHHYRVSYPGTGEEGQAIDL